MTLTAEEKEVLYLLKTDPAHERYFFTNAKSLKWFYPLKAAHLFAPEAIRFDEKGNAYFWPVLDYLLKVSEQVKDDPQYAPELISIIRSLVRYSSEVKAIRNYHIWWYCIRFLNNLPPSTIRENLPIADSKKDGEVEYGFKSLLLAATDPSTGGSVLSQSDIGDKLLVKFLNEDTTLVYADEILESMLSIRGKGKPIGSFGEDDVVLLWDRHWVLQSIQKHKKEIGTKCSVKSVLGIADKLKAALEYSHHKSLADMSAGADVYQLELSRIANDLPGGEISFRPNSFVLTIRQYADQHLKDAGEDAWAQFSLKAEREVKKTPVQAADEKAFIEVASAALPEQLMAIDSAERKDKLSKLYKALRVDYSQIWSRSLADTSEHIHDAEHALTSILRDVLLEMCALNPTSAKQVLERFLTTDYYFVIFKRFVLLCMDKHWSTFGDIFTRFIEVLPDALDAECEVELHDLLLHHNGNFSKSITDHLSRLIADVPIYYVQKGDKYVAYWKFKWLSPLKDNPVFRADFDRAKEIVSPKNGAPYEPERQTTRGGFVRDYSPLTSEEILKMPNVDLIKYLNEFVGADTWGSFEDGLADTLQAAAKENPSKFTGELALFIDAPYLYVRHIIAGLRDAWKSNIGLDWESCLRFFHSYLGQGKEILLKKAFEAQGEDSGEGKYIWVIDDVVDLISEGTRDDKHAFDPKYLAEAEKIFDLIMPLLKGEEKAERDALTYVFNTTAGKTVKAFVDLSLRRARVIKQKETHWGMLKFERYFDIGIDAYIWFGDLLPQFIFIDKEYAEKKRVDFEAFPPETHKWQMFLRDTSLVPTSTRTSILRCVRII